MFWFKYPPKVESFGRLVTRDCNTLIVSVYGFDSASTELFIITPTKAHRHDLNF